MMAWATWAAIVVLGPGSIAIFAWFVRDFIVMMREPRPAEFAHAEPDLDDHRRGDA